MNKIYKYIGVAAMAITCLSSCDLDSMSMTEKDTSNFPTTKEDCQQALAGVYANLNGYSDSPQFTYLFNALLASDDMLGGGGGGDQAIQAQDMLKNFGTDMTKSFFLQRYQGINRANTLLEALNNVSMNEEDMNDTEGQLLFLRGFFYYELASMYNKVPLVLTAKVPSDLTPPSAADLWGQILLDLKEACDLLPAKNNHNNGMIDKYCAEVMLGRAWLYYTGMYCNGEDILQLTDTH